MREGLPKSWGDDLNKLRADYPDLHVWTINGYWWLMADPADAPVALPLIRRRTPELLREALEARERGEGVPLDLEP